AEIPAHAPAAEKAAESGEAAPDKPRRRTSKPAAAKAEQAPAEQAAGAGESAPRAPRRRTRKAASAAPADAE
ncbi:ATP-dependent helicase, partial [Streptomyces albidoflavus]